MSMGEMQKWVVLGWGLLALVCAHDCPNGGHCEDDHTCCSALENGYDCCPFQQAECCEDNIHCCPEGTLCNVQESACMNATMSFPWSERVSAGPPRLSKSFRMIRPYLGEDDDNICPDLSRCPPEFSCLRTLTRFGCCPLAQGVSCSDGKHCCPEGHQCSADSRSCIKKELVSTVMCSDGKSECPEETTCCEAPDGSWGCCPIPKAVCCGDKTHCCPEGSTCDVQQLKCMSLSTNKAMPMWAKLPARRRADWENQKDGAQVTAQVMRRNEVTTSPVTEQAENTVTCEDCGQESTQGTEHVLTMLGDAETACNVSCDSNTACPDKTTCCKNTEGGWACCHLQEAVCCEDHMHCCPRGYTCDLTNQTCLGLSGSVPAVKKVPAYTTVAPSSQGTSQGTENAPTTHRDDGKAFNISCDSTTSCPDGTTCCKNTSGGWDCCNMPEAVCCEDHINCCPQGYTCDMAEQMCNGLSGSVPAVKKVPAYTTVAPSSQVTSQGTENAPTTHGDDGKTSNISCDSTTSCPDGTTCCRNTSGGWDCCNMPEAVCCEDHINCCPQGYTCDMAEQMCNGLSGSVPAVKKVPAYTTVAPSTVAATTQELGEEEEDGIPCDQHISCPKHTTCCFMASTQKWGCCPLPEAVCCKGGAHCCPKDYSCDPKKATCYKGEVVIPWYNKLPATNSLNAAPNAVECDVQNACPEHSTCCQLSTGQWGCCPLHEAVCCPDMEHCCPQGYSCNLGSASCLKVTMLQLQRVPLTRVYGLASLSQPTPLPKLYDLERVVQCEGQSSCKDGETCCRTSTTTWGCCPSLNAVCCNDMKHCCPNGHTCSKDGTCSQNTSLSWDNWQQFFFNKK